jgi:hypothetical protein
MFDTNPCLDPIQYHNDQLISLRLLALILCSNCSNLINIKFGVIDPTMLNYFLKPGGSLVLAQHPPRMVLAFHSPP